MPFNKLASVFIKVAETREQLEKVRLLRDLLRLLIAHAPQDVLGTVYMAANQLAPALDGIHMRVGEKTFRSMVLSVFPGIRRAGT